MARAIVCQSRSFAAGETKTFDVAQEGTCASTPAPTAGTGRKGRHARVEHCRSYGEQSALQGSVEACKFQDDNANGIRTLVKSRSATGA